VGREQGKTHFVQILAGPERQPPAHLSGDRSTLFGLLGVSVIWGTNFAVIKVALEELSPGALNALRFPIASAVLLLLLWWRGRLGFPRRQDVWRVLGLGVLGNVLYQLLFIHGLNLTSAGNASLLLATVPVWTILLSSALGHERPSPLVWIGILGTMGGMVLVVIGGSGVELGGASLDGDLLMAAAALAWAGYTVGSRGLIREYGPLRTTSWTLAVGTVGLVALGWPDLSGLSWAAVSPLAWFGVVYAGVFALSVAYILWYRGVQRIGSSRTAAYSNLVPVVALLVAWGWLGEVPSQLQWVGAAVILGGISVTRMGTTQKRG
jgi:drug/metabolite transporter (DMT)-like permease